MKTKKPADWCDICNVFDISGTCAHDAIPAAPALPDVAEVTAEQLIAELYAEAHAEDGPFTHKNLQSILNSMKAAVAGEQRGEAPDDGTEHEFDDSDGIGECSVRVILPGNGWYRCGKTKEEHRPTGDAADQIVSSLYRRFKDWSKRGFGPDDVTWCEVKADVIALMRAELSRNHPSHAGYKSQEAQPLPARPISYAQVHMPPTSYSIEAEAYMNYLEAELSRLTSKEEQGGESLNLFGPCRAGFHHDCARHRAVDCACDCHRRPTPPDSRKD